MSEMMSNTGEKFETYNTKWEARPVIQLPAMAMKSAIYTEPNRTVQIEVNKI